MKGIILVVAVLFVLYGMAVARDCFLHALTSVPGPRNSKVNINAWKNTDRCTCAKARQQAQRARSWEGYTPECDSKGKFKVTQQVESVGLRWCVSPQTGDQISDTFTAGKSALNCATFCKTQRKC